MHDKELNFEEQYSTFNRENAWSEFFQLINESSYKRYSSNKMTVARKMKNSNLNRYTDVLPYDDSRVKLNDLDNDYINASLVKVEKANRNYILTQGPVPKSVQHFWVMIWQQNSRCIVMLNKLVENGIDKCYLYWPTKNKNLKFERSGFEVELISEKEDETNFDFVVREFKLTNLKDNTSRNIFQFHTLCWPDFGVPKSPESFLNFFHTCRKSGFLDSNKYGPAIIHCSAAIGRSGVFILVDSFLILLKKSFKDSSIKPDVSELLLEMRNYRLGLVQTHQQLRFAYEAIIKAMNHELFKDDEPSNNVIDEQIPEQKITEQQSIVEKEVIEQEDKTSEQNELRQRIREEKKQTTLNHIKRIKDKQKEIETWSERTKLIKYVGITILMTSIFVGSLYYKFRPLNFFN